MVPLAERAARRIAWALLPVLLLLEAGLAAQAQTPSTSRFTVSGFVEDAETGERLIGATVYDTRARSGTTTNAYGFFALTIRADSSHLQVAYLGYAPLQEEPCPGRDRGVTFRLEPQTVELDGVEVVAEGRALPNTHTVRLTARDLEDVPALLGERDALKALQLLPGVQSGAEGTSGLYVRGGTPDQNLLLLDGAPVYNAAHAFGAFSVFNPDALQSVHLIKSGFPARYGGRLASVLEVTMREGSANRFAGAGSVGLIASRLTLEGPLVRDRSAFIVSARRTYADLLARPFLHNRGAKVGYFFYDVNAKAHVAPSARSRFFASLYTGDDRFYSAARETFQGSGETETTRAALGWGNTTLTLRGTRLLGPRLFASFLVLHSQYRFGTERLEQLERPAPTGSLTGAHAEAYAETYTFAHTSGLRDYAAKLDVDFVPGPRHALRFGAAATHHAFVPGRTRRTQGRGAATTLDTTRADPVSAFEAAGYVEEEMRLAPGLQVHLGLHATAYHVRTRWYTSLQPRLSATAELGHAWSLSGSATRMRQHLHLLTHSGVGLPTDLWVPATDRIGPEDGRQYTLGVGRRLEGYDLAAEVFHRSMKGLVAYRAGSSFLETIDAWEDAVTTGRGHSTGLELLVTKTRGSLQGSLGYTLSRTRRRFAALNGGRAFPFRYDRTHDLALSLTRALSARRRLTLTWVYGTGQAVTLPVARYTDGLARLEHYGSRNAARLPAYHRLDLAYHVRFSPRWGRGELVLGLYNAYNRRNAFYVTLEERTVTDPETGRVYVEDVYRQVSLFPILPAVSYSFSF